jgi:hypothetical protein
MIGLPWHVAEDVDLGVVYPGLMTLLLDAGCLHFPNEGRVSTEYRSGAPMPLSFRGKQASPNAYSAQSTKNMLTALMRHEQAVSSISVAAFATGPLGHRRSRG